MRDRLLKIVPIVVGLVLGWMLFNPPAFLEWLGPGRYLVMAGMVVLLLLAFTAVQILANLPDDVSLEPLTEDALQGELRALHDRFRDLGFTPVGPPFRVGVAPPAVLAALVHEREPVYATIFQTGTIPAKVSFDVVSILEGDRGGLTTCALAAGAALPASPGSLRQVFRGAPPEKVVQGHLDGLAYLGQRGLRARAVRASAFVLDFKGSFRRQRAAFLSSPLVRTVQMFGRASTGTTPHEGSIRTQPAAEREIQALLTGSTGDGRRTR